MTTLQTMRDVIVMHSADENARQIHFAYFHQVGSYTKEEERLEMYGCAHSMDDDVRYTMCDGVPYLMVYSVSEVYIPFYDGARPLNDCGLYFSCMCSINLFVQLSHAEHRFFVDGVAEGLTFQW